MTIAALFILVFFTVYASSCFVTVGKLFNSLFGFSYQTAMIGGAIFVIYTPFLEGFWRKVYRILCRQLSW